MRHFRVFDKIEKKYLEISRKFHFYYDSENGLMISTGWNNEKEPIEYIEADKERYIVEWFTGMYDEEAKAIYQGDIIQFTYWWFDGNERDTILTGIIVYSPENMSFQLKGVKNKEWQQYTGYTNDEDYLTPFSELNFTDADFSIIGNINLNPEKWENIK